MIQVVSVVLPKLNILTFFTLHVPSMHFFTNTKLLMLSGYLSFTYMRRLIIIGCTRDAHLNTFFI